ncbi:group II intron reverse transcriptase/maturase (plasmid) [Bacillus thuringiensis]|uniref:group II intron reverse transcriptase/maturase n=1 Tax=Bacillus thuringiensis TaxID=1428 RepID=UPI003977D514
MANRSIQPQYYNFQGELDGLYVKSKNGGNFKDLYSFIIDERNIKLAFGTIKSNQGSKTPGTDQITINEYKGFSDDEIIHLVREKLINFKPDSVRRVFIPKADGKSRPLGIPTMLDRIIQQCFKQILEPIVEAKFYEHSYGFRPLRSTHHAIARTNFLININKLHYCVDIDIKGFFDNINHNKLIKQLWNIGVRDKQVLAIIKKMLKCEIVGEGKAEKGTPQGGILSPLLANVVLNDLDHWVASQWHNFPTNTHYEDNRPRYRVRKKTKLKQGFIVRYADDFKIFTNSYNSAKRWFHAVKNYIEKNLKLEISESKSKITNLRKRKSLFLGIEFKAVAKKKKFVAQSYIPKDSMKSIQANIKKKVKSIRINTIPVKVSELNAYIRGVHDYFKVATQVNKGFHKITYHSNRVIYNRLKGKVYFHADNGSNKGYKKSGYKTFNVGGIQAIPIGNVSHSSAMNFSQAHTIYSEESRVKYGHKEKAAHMKKAFAYLERNFVPNRSIEFNDNRIRRFAQTQGRCEISGIEMAFYPKMVRCHHVKRRADGGDDNYRNLIIVHELAHRLLHATKPNLIEKLMKQLMLSDKQVEKVNKLRSNMNLFTI